MRQQSSFEFLTFSKNQIRTNTSRHIHAEMKRMNLIYVILKTENVLPPVDDDRPNVTYISNLERRETSEKIRKVSGRKTK